MALDTNTMGENILTKQKVKKVIIPGVSVKNQIVETKEDTTTYEALLRYEIAPDSTDENDVATALTNAAEIEDGTAEGVIQHIKAAAETEGSTNEIIELKDEVEKLRSLLQNICNVFLSWTPIIHDGGAALKASMASVASQGVTDMAIVSGELQKFTYDQMSKNII